jgi:hypothetical protein
VKPGYYVGQDAAMYRKAGPKRRTQLIAGNNQSYSLIHQMSDSELLRFGMTAKFMCSLGADSNLSPESWFAVQLKKAAKEWRKRFPNLPLVATLDHHVAETPKARPRLVSRPSSKKRD